MMDLTPKMRHKANVFLFLAVAASLCLSASAADPIVYQVDEEVRQEYRIGNIISGAGLDAKYNQTVLNQLRFTFLTQSQHRDLFWLGEHNGDLRTAGRLDRDEICPRQEVCDINLDIAVQPVQYFQAIKITVRVRDLNDNDPKFPEQTMKSAISEANVPGILFPIPSATDPDSPKFSIKRYEFFSDSDKFELRVRNSSDGTLDLHLALKEMLDREEEEHYEMTVIAFDGGSPPRTGSVKIEISVLDMNDNSPKFVNTSYIVNVPENTEPNISIIKVTAVDPDSGDNGQVEYSFASRTLNEYGDTFGIEPTTGDIYLTGKLDYETVQQYHLTVQAQDKGPDALPSSIKVTVNVVDVNDHAPQITINALNEDEHAQVPEDAETPFFVAHISVFDPDQGVNGQFNCSLDDKDFKLVQLFETEFKVMAMVSLDREEQALHNVRITCSDNGNPPMTAMSYLTVVVVDKNDNGPRFTQNTYFATVTENNNINSYVLQVSAVDKDEGSNADVEYSLEVNAQEAFKVEPTTGVIRANTRFDRENIQNLEFKVTAADHGTPPRTATATILVTVLDMDDNSPRFTEDRFVMSVEENLPENSQVGQLTAVDGDLPPFNEFYFYIVADQSAANYFSLDLHTGVISTRRELDRESKLAYSMNVVVKSKNPYQPNSTAQVIIYVDDVNDNSPIVDFPNIHNRTVFISNQVPIGYVVTRIVAHDKDDGKNAKLMYSITEGNEHGEFVIGSSTGDIFVNTKFENIEEKTYTLIIMVKDLGFPQRITIETLKIIVNESIPFVPLMGAQGSKQISDIQLIIIICVILGTVVVATLLIAAIVVLKCKERKSSKPPQYFQRTEQSQYDAAGGVDAKENCDTKISTPVTTTVLAGGGHNKPEVLDHTVIKADFDEDPNMSHSALDPAKMIPYCYGGAGPRYQNYGSYNTWVSGMELQSPAGSSGEKDSDSGCCADMSTVEGGMGANDDFPDQRSPYSNPGGSGSILKIKCYHPPSHRRIPGRQSSFTDWLNSESQNLRQSGHVYRVTANPPGPTTGPAQAGKSVRFDDPEPEDSGNRLAPVSSSTLPQQPRKLHFPHNYRTLGGRLSPDTIPEEPEHIQDIMGRNSPNIRWTDDGSLV